MAKVKDIAMQIRGVSYHPEDLHDNLDEDSVVLLRANNIKDGKLILDDVVYVSKSKVAEQQYLQTGDILICASSGSKELVGKAAFVDSVKNPMTFGAFCKVVRPQPEYSEYLGHYFNSPVYRRKISALSAGANINNIKNEHIDNLDIQLVDEKERREIITILNELNMLISLRKQQLFKLDELVKARFVEMFGGYVPNAKLSDIASITGGLTKNSNRNKMKLKLPYLRVANVSYAKIDVSEMLEIGLTEDEKAKTLLSHDDLLFVEGNGSPDQIGRVALWRNEITPCVHQNHLIKARFISHLIVPCFALYYFMSQEGRKQIRSKAVSTSGLYTLSVSKISNLLIPTPPLSLQNQFAAFVERVDQQKQTVQQSLEKLELMKKALIQEYFG